MHLIECLAAAPELRGTASGKHVTSLQVAMNGKNYAEFRDVVFWRQAADFARGCFGKARLVCI